MIIAEETLLIEEAVIGQLLSEETSFMRVAERVKSPNVFFKEEHRQIYAAAMALTADGVGVDLITVSRKCKEQKGNVVTDIYMMDLINKVYTTAYIEDHVDILLRDYLRRNLLDFAQKTAMLASSLDSDPLQMLSDARILLDSLTDGLADKGERTWQDVLDEMVQQVIDIGKEGGLTGVPSGFTKIDNELGGWQPGQLIVVAARPGMGKSSFTVAISNHAAVAGKRVAIFSLEMTDVQIAKRFVSNNTNIHGNMLYNEGLTKIEYINKFDKAVAELRPLPLNVIQSPGLNVQTLAYKCKQLHAAGGLDLVVIDYIQIMDVLNDKANREQQISIISRALKRLALELNVPVIVLSQLNREVDKRSNKRPFLSDLRESGAIEQDADVVMFIYRHGYYVEQGMASPEGELDAAEFMFSKNRNGRLFTEDVKWDGNRTRFYHQHNEPVAWPQVEGFNLNQSDKAPY